MPQRAHGQFSKGQGELAALRRKMHFSACGIAATRYDSLRVGTGAEEGAVLSGSRPGGTGPAVAVGGVFSRGGGRLSPLRQHRGELAAARHLRRDELRRDHADALPPARIPCLSGGDFRALRDREFSRGPAGAGAVRPGDLLPHRRPGSAVAFSVGCAGRVSSGWTLSISRQLRRHRSDRDAGDIFHRSRAGSGPMRIWVLATSTANLSENQPSGWRGSAVASRSEQPSYCGPMEGFYSQL